MGKNSIQLWAGLFLVLCILFVPFTFNLFPYQQIITEFIFSTPLNNLPISSDSKGLYAIVFILSIVAFVVTFIIIGIKTKVVTLQKLKNTCHTICVYYLVAIFLKYGFDKVFKAQFYQPEPNTLYTKLVNLDKDILYWSTIGSSHLYNVVTGSVELLAAVLLLIKRTRAIGIALLLVVLSQVILINFAFDISVKLFSILLMCMVVYLSTSYIKNWIKPFLGSQIEVVKIKKNKNTLGLFLKTVVILLLFLEALLPYLKSKSINDDNKVRPYLHGAYAVNLVVNNKDTLQAVNYPFKRFFIHRNGYIIFEDNNENMQDFKLETDSITKKLLLTNYENKHTLIKYAMEDSLITLSYLNNNNLLTVKAKSINYKAMPLLKDSFNWTVD